MTNSVQRIAVVGPSQSGRAERRGGEPTITNGWYWGRELPGRPTLPDSDDFEARVEQAWAHMKGAFFAVEEHERLYACVGELLARREDTG
jgi:hypothetical protein